MMKSKQVLFDRLFENVPMDDAANRLVDGDDGGRPSGGDRPVIRDLLARMTRVPLEKIDEVLVALNEVQDLWMSQLPDVPSVPLDAISDAEAERLLPVAETLAMIDGNAFFALDFEDEVGRPRRWADQYLPEAKALVEANGGWNGHPAAASFAGTGWRKPETAPRDGTPVLLSLSNGWVIIAFHREETRADGKPCPCQWWESARRDCPVPVSWTYAPEAIANHVQAVGWKPVPIAMPVED